jgi:dTMP kinase
MKLPKFIAIEGIDGCGKTTQVDHLAKWLPTCGLLDNGQSIVVSREPGGTGLGKILRSMILDNSGEAPVEKAELLMYMADRAQHVDKVIRPALQRGDWVLLDRYVGSTVAYQGYGRGLPRNRIASLTDYVTEGLRPDLTIWLDTPLYTCMERTKSKASDRIESSGYEFMAKVQHGFIELCSYTPTWVRVDGSQDEHLIASNIQREIQDRLSS